jgi:hypothetical protein
MPQTSRAGSSDLAPMSRLVRAGILTAVSDGLFATVLSVGFFHSTAARLWQGVASTLLGPSAIDGGTVPALIGVLMHVGVAFGWSAVFWVLHNRSAGLRRLVESRRGALAVAALYGPSIWMVMSLAVIPLLVHRPPSMTFRWWVQLVGHAVFVALPIVFSIRNRAAAEVHPSAPAAA